MICKNCNYILSGSESFCPDCGTPCVKETQYRNEQTPPQVIFSPEKDVPSSVFTQEAPPEVSTKKEKKSRAGLYLVIVLCAVILGTVAVSVTDMLDFTPAIASLFSFSEEETTEKVASTAEYDPVSGIVSPAVSYRTSVGYISGETGQALRKGPDNSYGQIELLSVGTVVHIVGSESIGSEWVYVYIPETDSYGWLSSAYISSSLGDIDEEESEIYEEDEETEEPTTAATEENDDQ